MVDKSREKKRGREDRRQVYYGIVSQAIKAMQKSIVLGFDPK